jgi:hypothetical protein
MIRSITISIVRVLSMKMSSPQLQNEPSSQFNLSAALYAALFLLLILVFPMPSHATEEPEYQVVRQLADIEVRQYTGYTVAEVVVAGSAAEAGNLAFPILAAYIFGKNIDGRKFAMTAPVTQAAAPVKLEMTAPVMQNAAPGGFLVQFVLPKGVTLANAPKPLDARVTLREVPPYRVAVIRYSGFWSEANYGEHLAKLQAALRAAGLIAAGEAVNARYNAPFTPWFLRRNEIWLPLAEGP